jgi:putative MATE family efflux protein
MSKLVSSPGNIRPMLGLAIPVLAEESLTMLVGFTDWWLAGHFLVGEEYKAAMGLMSYVMWLLPSLFAAVAIGATAMVSRFVGAGDPKKAAHVTNQSLLIGLALAAVAIVTVVAAGSYFVRLMQLQDDAAELSLRYIWIVVPAIPAIMVEQVGAACLRGAGDTVSGFVAKSIVNVVNVVVSSLLVIGPGSIPNLGWDGLAIGTACGHGLGGLILFVLLLRGRAGLRLRRKQMKPDRDLIRRLTRIGLPGGMDVLGILFCHLVYLAIINSLGTGAAAAHGLGVQIEAMAYLPCIAFQVAASTMTGQFLGAGDPRRARRAAITTTAFGVGMLTMTALVFYFAGGMLAGFFTGNREDPTAQATAELVKIVAFATPSLAVVMVLTGALRGAGDTRWPLAISFLGLIGIRLPFSCWLAWDVVPIPLFDITLAGWDMGVAGAWWAMVVDVVLRSGLVVFRFWQGGWAKMRV